MTEQEFRKIAVQLKKGDYVCLKYKVDSDNGRLYFAEIKEVSQDTIYFYKFAVISINSGVRHYNGGAASTNCCLEYTSIKKITLEEYNAGKLNPETPLNGWISIFDRKPTEDDADDNENILQYLDDGTKMICGFYDLDSVWYWKPLAGKLPDPNPNSTYPQEFEDFYSKNDEVEKELAWKIWQAAKKE